MTTHRKCVQMLARAHPLEGSCWPLLLPTPAGPLDIHVYGLVFSPLYSVWTTSIPAASSSSECWPCGRSFLTEKHCDYQTHTRSQSQARNPGQLTPGLPHFAPAC